MSPRDRQTGLSVEELNSIVANAWTDDIAFADVVRVWRISTEQRIDTETAVAARAAFRSLLAAFQRRSDFVSAQFFSKSGAAVALVTPQKGRRRPPQSCIQLVLSELAIVDPVALDLLLKATEIEDRSVFLGKVSRSIVLRRVYAVLTAILGAIERDGGFVASLPIMRRLGRELDDVDRWGLETLALEGRAEYTSGAVAVAVVAGAALTAAVEFASVPDLALAAAGGLAGATISLLQRGAGALDLARYSQRHALHFFGGVRVLFGSLFAVAIATTASAFPIDGIPGDRGQHLAFLFVIGFLAGFAERFAVDAISNTHLRRGDDPAAQLARSAKGVVQRGWRSPRRAEATEFLRLAVSESIQEVFSGPKPVNWTGFVRAELVATTRESPPQPNPHRRLRVTFASLSRDPETELPIDIVDGEEADAAPFRIVPSSSSVEFAARSADLLVPAIGEREIEFEFVAPDSAEDQEIWVQIRQHNRTVQVVSVSFVADSHTGIHGR